MTRPVKVKETLGSRLSSGAQDLAYAAANGIEDLYGRKMREAIQNPPGSKAIRGRPGVIDDAVEGKSRK
jgi:hypothetical protein